MQVNMHDAKTHLSKLVQAVLDGEEVILARNGEAVVQITKYTPVKHKRKPGSLKGKIWLADDWDSPETNRIINEMMVPKSIFPDEPVALSGQDPRTPYVVTPRKPLAPKRATQKRANRRA